MSSTALKSTAKKILKAIADADRRRQAEYDPKAQIFILNLTALEEFCISAGIPFNRVEAYYTSILKSMSSKFISNPKYAYLIQYAEDLKANKIPTKEPLPKKFKIFFVSSKGRADEAKRRTGIFIETEFGVTASSFTGVVQKGSSIEETSGFQTGHGEFGTAISGTRVLAADRLLRTKKTGAVKKALEGSKLQSIVNEYKVKFNIDLTLNSSTILNADGSLKAEYISVLSNEVSIQNLRGGKEEAKNLENFKKAIQEELDVLNQKGSPTLSDQLEAHILHKFSSKKTKNKKVTTRIKPKRSSKTKSKSGKVTKESSIKVRVGIIKGNPVHLEKGKVKSTINLRSLIPVINARLPEQVAANMGSPALNMRTGRFASSVRVIDIVRTSKGFPSIGYTYMRSPYEVFEYPKGSPSLATPERDPRKIIGKSIRDIAIGLIQQRFFTRRV
jgi:hypothetical protein